MCTSAVVPLILDEIDHPRAVATQVLDRRFDRQESIIAAGFEEAKQRAVVGLAAFTGRDPAFFVGQVDVTDQRQRRPNVFERLILDPEVLGVEKQEEIGMIDGLHIRGGFIDRVDDVPFAAIERLDH